MTAPSHDEAVRLARFILASHVSGDRYESDAMLSIAKALIAIAPSAIPSAMVRPGITFMYDNHTFQKIDVSDGPTAFRQIMECFAEDGSGSAFITWASADGQRPRDVSRPKDYVLHGHDVGERWGVTDTELNAFLDRLYAIEPREADRRKK